MTTRKRLYILITMMFIHTINYGQNYFNINSSIGKTFININGKIYTIDSSYTRIKTAFPKFDTLSFGDDSLDAGTKIVCNFKPDSSYSLIIACCASTDIIQSWKTKYDSLKIWNMESDFYKIQSLLMDKPKITLKITKGSIKDSIYGWYSDYACPSKIKLLDEKGWKYGVPKKCFYWSNISPFVFFKSQTDYSKSMNKDGVIENEFPEEDAKTIGVIYIRLFDNNNYTIKYNIQTKIITLTYDD